VRHLTFANVMSLCAVFIALGGVGYAAVKLPANSVGTSQIRDSAVTGAKVKKGSLTASDFAVGQLPSGPQGKPGDQGAAGAVGATGATGATGSTPSLYPLQSWDENPPASVDPSPLPASQMPIVLATRTKNILGSGVYGLNLSIVTQATSSGNGQLAVGLYVDGSPVPGTAFGIAGIPAGTASCSIETAYNAFYREADVNFVAGVHTIQVRAAVFNLTNVAGCPAKTFFAGSGPAVPSTSLP